VIRAVAAVVCGIVLAGMVYVCAWQQMGNSYGFQREHHFTWIQLDAINGEIAEHIKEHGRPPESLAEVAPDESDSWGHPLVYTVRGDAYELLSLGHDGRPGGIGIDADIRTGEQRPPPMPSLYQFTFEMPTEGIRLTSIVAGLFATVMCWRLMRDTAESPGIVQLVACGFTLMFAWFAAMIMAALHVPSGH
jgi:hypothetical protein